MKNYISLNIKYLCDKNFLSQKDFGKLFNLTQAVVNAYIKGKSNPQIDTILKICTHFDLSLDDFIASDLSSIKDTTAGRTVAMAEHGTDSGTDKDITIAALRETIDAQKELIANLRSQLNRAS